MLKPLPILAQKDVPVSINEHCTSVPQVSAAEPPEGQAAQTATGTVRAFVEVSHAVSVS